MVVEKVSKVPNNLRSMRYCAGYSARTLANAVGVSQGAVLRWEKGTVTPKIEHLRKLVELLGKPVGKIFPALSQIYTG